MSISDLSPAVKAYRSCGIHNRTLEELRRDTSLLRRAVLGSDNDVAHVPNVFGKFEHQGVTYHTVLTLIGIDDPFDNHTVTKPSRGISQLRIRDVEGRPKSKLWEFCILIPKKHCHEGLCVEANGDKHLFDDFCGLLTDRTFIFAMEFLCCYRFFIEQVQETFELGNCVVREPWRETDNITHPTEREVSALICRYDTIAANLEWLKQHEPLAEWDFSSIQQFLGLHIGRNRKAFLSYYLKWLRDHRVAPEIVERRTIEFIAMAFLDKSFEN